jgi:peptidoglycan/xylan/chitin deacetylase (PgdA/CDA1 family)
VTVSFTFDDTYKPQVDAAAILEAHGLRGTFYVNSPQLHRASANPASASSMSISDVLELQSRGHDIGGHTLGHLSLTDVPEVERNREILGDRSQLVHLGIDARSFAYPYGHVEADSDRTLGRPVLEIARSSGYSSARDTNGVDLEDCAAGPETLPPEDPFILRSIRSVNEPPDGAARLDPPDTAATLLRWMDQTARCGGGWLPLIFHHLRADCSEPDAPAGYCFDLPELELLADQLATGTRCPEDGGRCYRVRVATVSAAIGATELEPAPEVSGLRNPSLERTLDSGETECIQTTGASSTAVFRRSQVAHSGQASQRLAISAPYQAPAEIGIERDFGECSEFASEGRAYDLSLYYRAEPDASLPTLRVVTYRLTAAYVWRQWETSEAFAARSPGTWVRRAFTTAAVPADTIALSFGLRQESAGVIEVDDFDAVPGGG